MGPKSTPSKNLSQATNVTAIVKVVDNQYRLRFTQHIHLHSVAILWNYLTCCIDGMHAELKVSRINQFDFQSIKHR